MFIQTASTPNPATLKFLPGREVLGAGAGTEEFPDTEAAAASPLAAALFDAPGVVGVMFGGDFLTVTKAESADWDHLKPALLAAIMDHFTSGASLFVDGAGPARSSAPADETYDEETAEIVSEIRDLLEKRVRPAVAGDGGDIQFHRFDKDTGQVFLTMHGACAGCPSSEMTLKMGIENLLKHYVPEVTSVVPVA